MKLKILVGACFTFALFGLNNHYIKAQVVKAQYLKPEIITSPYEFIRLGDHSLYFGGLMHNISEPLYGDGDDFSIFTYNNRDLILRAGTGNVILNHTTNAGNVGVGLVNPLEKLHVAGNSQLDGRLKIKKSGTLANKYNSANAVAVIGDGSINMLIDGNELFTNHALYLGSHSSHPIVFGNVSANGFNKQMTIENNGNVGIGVANPNYKLQVEGEVRFQRGAGGNNYVKIHSDAAASYITSDDDGTNQKNLIIQAAPSGDNLEDRHIIFKTGKENGNFKERMKIAGNGNVGIGTNNPTAKLDIRSIGDGAVHLKFSSERSWAFMQQGTGAQTALVLKDLSGGKHFRINSYNNENSFFFSPSDGKSYFRGNMGIGTMSPTAKLHVNGDVLASEVRVSTDAANVPDYVFKPDYKLTSLEEVEAYIQKESHLPEVPSAEEIAANGHNLAEMNLLLLKKIEELTLHSIRQEKLIKAQKSELKEHIEQEKQTLELMKALESRIEKLEEK